MSLTSLDPAPRGLLRNRDVALLVTATFVSRTGDWLLSTALAYQVFALTGSALASAGVLLASQLPQVLLGPPAGAAADRFDRRRLLIVANLLTCVALAPLLLVRDAHSVGLVYPVLVATCALAPFAVSAEAALLPSVVDPRSLVAANALNGQARDVARLAGAALGGGLVALGGLGVVAVVDAATFVAAAVLVALVRRPSRTGEDRPAARGSLAAGLAAIRRSRPLTVLLAVFLLTGAGEGAMGALFAPFAREVLGADAAAYGAILAVQSVGGIAGGAVLTAIGHRFRPRSLLGVGAVVFGALDGALFLAPLVLPGTAPAFLLIALVGLPAAAVTAGSLTVFQTTADPGERGRVFGVLIAAQNGTMLLGAVVAGAAAAPLGIVPVLCLQAAAYVAAGAAALVGLRPGARA